MNTISPTNEPEQTSASPASWFDVSAETTRTEAPAPAPAGKPRLQRANRRQLLLLPTDLDQLIPEDHPARVVWSFVEQMDLRPLLKRIRAVENHPGRSAIDPKILLALWLYATLDGQGSARYLADLCENHAAYRWLCGGVSVNYHTLSDFRTDHVDFLDDLLTRGVATLMHEGLVALRRVAQDGMKVRASAGAASYRREATLQECLREAQEQVRTLRAEHDADPGLITRRQQATKKRVAEDRQKRLTRALEQLAEMKAKNPPKEPPASAEPEDQTKKPPKEPRASSTDPEARIMKMGDGGFRPAYNVQLMTDTASQIIVGVEVTNAGGDQGQMAPMVEQVQERYEQAPKEVLVDGGFVKKEDIETVGAPEVGAKVYAPVQKSKTPKRDPHTPRADDGPAVAEWRQRMATPEAKEIYKERAATAECVNAQARNRGLYQFLVRGLRKVKAVALWYALAHNLLRTVTLRAAAADTG